MSTLHGPTRQRRWHRVHQGASRADCRRWIEESVSCFPAEAEVRRYFSLPRERALQAYRVRGVSAVFSELIRLGSWHKVNPLAKVRQLKTDQVELTYLTLDQVSLLLEECKASMNTYTYPVAMLCLATDARWNEAESLPRGAVQGGKVHYHRTKNRQSRAVPIPKDLERLILKRGMPGTGRLFMSCRAAFRSAYRRCGFHTPGQMTHILRHTFASHYMMGGGDILTLQRILGHSSITMTMRYAHLSPEHLESAMRLSPLVQSEHQLDAADIDEAEDDMELCRIVEKRVNEPSREVSLDEL